MKTGPEQRWARRSVLSEILQRIRGLRNLTRQAAARGMGLEARSFERFEAGDVRPEVGRVFDFAKATDSDPLAIFASLYLGTSDLARSCADNKLMIIQAMSLERLSRRLGDRLSKVDAATWIDIQDRLADELVKEMDAREARAREWLEKPPDDA